MALDDAIALFERLISEELKHREWLLTFVLDDPTNGTRFAIEQSDRVIATYQMLIEKAKCLAQTSVRH
ncbi:hypothetical protein [Mesorhizobium sp. DCY119]|uniref:hypothetical protein n=1 Tax=Mesorhizobium sp. DCY119 TaxID=2108445 RepID=UPI000E71EF25|nr:hypothetical protein [Mesorhizobium sp. DCY119]RJG46652.1 hypothetical protein D3Y55_21945 [Mesorhizobium sp. DCY119]